MDVRPLTRAEVRSIDARAAAEFGLPTLVLMENAGRGAAELLALVGATFTPEAFRCAVSIVGPSNLETFIASIPPYWQSFYENLVRRIGDPRTEAGRALLKARSPLTRAGAIARPLLILQGAIDALRNWKNAPAEPPDKQ